MIANATVAFRKYEGHYYYIDECRMHYVYDICDERKWDIKPHDAIFRVLLHFCETLVEEQLNTSVFKK